MVSSLEGRRVSLLVAMEERLLIIVSITIQSIIIWVNAYAWVIPVEMGLVIISSAITFVIKTAVILSAFVVQTVTYVATISWGQIRSLSTLPAAIFTSRLVARPLMLVW
jgi:hypothetical protein